MEFGLKFHGRDQEFLSRGTQIHATCEQHFSPRDKHETTAPGREVPTTSKLSEISQIMLSGCGWGVWTPDPAS